MPPYWAGERIGQAKKPGLHLVSRPPHAIDFVAENHVPAYGELGGLKCRIGPSKAILPSAYCVSYAAITKT